MARPLCPGGAAGLSRVGIGLTEVLITAGYTGPLPALTARSLSRAPLLAHNDSLSEGEPAPSFVTSKEKLAEKRGEKAALPGAQEPGRAGEEC